MLVTDPVLLIPAKSSSPRNKVRTDARHPGRRIDAHARGHEWRRIRRWHLPRHGSGHDLWGGGRRGCPRARSALFVFKEASELQGRTPEKRQIAARDGDVAASAATSSNQDRDAGMHMTLSFAPHGPAAAQFYWDTSDISRRLKYG